MSNQSEQNQASVDRDLEELFNRVGRRPEPPLEMREAVRASVHLEWQREVWRNRRRRRIRWAVGLAASVLCGVLAWQVQLTPPTEPAMVARISGQAEWSEDRETWSPVYLGQEIVEGYLRSGDGLSLDLGDTSLRLDQASTVEVVDNRTFELIEGRVYADTGEEPGTPSEPGVVILAADARVTDIGTQFMVELEDQALVVSVREGLVEVSADGDQHRAAAGSRLQVEQDGATRLTTIAPYEDAWRWVAELAPAPALEGQSLHSFLQWVARERGLTLDFATPASLASAQNTILHGSIDDLAVEELLEAVMATTELQASEQGEGYLRVDFQH